eukprot:2229948-Amphidinium_carterae.1
MRSMLAHSRSCNQVDTIKNNPLNCLRLDRSSRQCRIYRCTAVRDLWQPTFSTSWTVSILYTQQGDLQLQQLRRARQRNCGA